MTTVERNPVRRLILWVLGEDVQGPVRVRTMKRIIRWLGDDAIVAVLPSNGRVHFWKAKPAGKNEHTAFEATPYFDATREAVTWLIQQGWLQVDIQPEQILRGPAAAYYKAASERLGVLRINPFTDSQITVVCRAARVTDKGRDVARKAAN